MPCPICSHTLQNIGLSDTKRRVFWCPRCGVLKTETHGKFVPEGGGEADHVFEEYEAPKLVPLACQIIRAVQAADHARVGQLMTVALDLGRAIEHAKEAVGGAV